MVSRKNQPDQNAIADCLDQISCYSDQILGCVEVLKLIIELSEHPTICSSKQMNALATQTAAEWDSLSFDLSKLVNRLATYYSPASASPVETDHS